MGKANLHGYGPGEFGTARIKLGVRRTEQYEDARRRINKGLANEGQFIANPAPNSLPLKTSNNRKWNENAR